MKEKLTMSSKVENLEKELVAEKKLSAGLQTVLNQQYRKIHMFAGTKKLDKILSYGRREKTHEGLGYTEQGSVNTGLTKFVSRGTAYQNHDDSEKRTNKTGCYFCGKNGHIRVYCYKYWEKVRRLKKQERFFWNRYKNQI